MGFDEDVKLNYTANLDVEKIGYLAMFDLLSRSWMLCWYFFVQLETIVSTSW